MSPTRTKPAALSVEQTQQANRMLWQGILGQHLWMIETALKDGANTGAGPDQEILDNPRSMKINAHTLPLTALFLSHTRWGIHFDTRAMDYKKACKALIIKTPKKYYGVRDDMTPLLAYSQVDKRKQKHSLLDMVLRRTPVDTLQFCDDEGRSCLFYAIKNGRTQDVKAIVRAGFDPTYQDEKGRNALHWEYWARLLRTRKEQQDRQIIEFLLIEKVPLVADHEGYHILLSDPKIPLSLAGDLDINNPGRDGETLAILALRHFAWDRWRQLLDDPRTDWVKQIPDLDDFVKQRNQRSFSNNVAAAAMYEEIISIRQHLGLQITTPLANERPRARF